MKGTRKSNSFKRDEIELLCHLFEKVPTNPDFRLLARRQAFSELMRKFHHMREQIRLEDLAIADAERVAKANNGVLAQFLGTAVVETAKAAD